MSFYTILISCQLYGQTVTTRAQFKKYALQFQIDRDFTLGSFQGTIISLKRNFSNKTALRFGLILNGQIGNTEEEKYLTPNDTILSNRITNDDFLDIKFLAQFIFYPSRGDIQIFFGGGPLVNYFPSRRNDELQTKGRHINFFKREAWIIGFSLPVGVEWFFKKNISIGGE